MSESDYGGAGSRFWQLREEHSQLWRKCGLFVGVFLIHLSRPDRLWTPSIRYRQIPPAQAVGECWCTGSGADSDRVQMEVSIFPSVGVVQVRGGTRRCDTSGFVCELFSTIYLSPVWTTSVPTYNLPPRRRHRSSQLVIHKYKISVVLYQTNGRPCAPKRVDQM